MPDLKMSIPTFKCKCGKVYAMNEEDARRMRNRMVKKTKKNNPVRYYPCEFNGWHWTSQLKPRTESNERR